MDGGGEGVRLRQFKGSYYLNSGPWGLAYRLLHAVSDGCTQKIVSGLRPLALFLAHPPPFFSLLHLLPLCSAILQTLTQPTRRSPVTPVTCHCHFGITFEVNLNSLNPSSLKWTSCHLLCRGFMNIKLDND